MKKIIENYVTQISNPLRAVRLLIVLLGVIGVLLSCAPADESGGVGGCGGGGYEDENFIGMGTTCDPFQISSASDLSLMSELVNGTDTNYRSAHYEVTTDIDLGIAGAPWAEGPAGTPGDGFNPIGIDYNDAFTGSLDCAGNTISNLFINRGSANNIGLIRYLGSDGTVSNCNLVDVNVAGGSNTGGLVGYSFGTISDSSTTGDVTGGSSTGGLVGYNNGGTITGSTVSVAVTGSSHHVGGLVGGSSGDISNSYATGAVTGRSGVGGLVGWSDGSISNSYATGDVTGSLYIGGLVGYNYSGGTISNSYAIGAVEGSDQSVGGLVGYNYSGGTISNSYATGAVTGSGSRVGGLIGSAGGPIAGGTISSSIATGAVTGSNYVGGLIGQVENDINISNVYARGAVSISNSTETSSGGLIGGVVGTSTTTIANSYTVSTGAVRSFVGEVLSTATLTVTNSYAQTGSGLGFTPTSTDSLSEESRDDLKMPTTAGENSLYIDWDTAVWDFGMATELPILSGLPAEFVQARD